MIEHLADHEFGDNTEPATDPALLRRVVGLRLRRLREAAGLSGETAGRAIRASHSKISRMEAGRVIFRQIDIEDLLTRYGVYNPVVRSELLAMARRANDVGRWRTGPDLSTARPEAFLALEDTASVIRCYAPCLIPELAQTPSYAHTVYALADRVPTTEIHRRVEQLTRRQRLLERTGAPTVWLIVEEAVLASPFGGALIRQTQLEHLATLAARPHITVQVMPAQVGGPAIGGVAFTLLRFADPELCDIAHLSQPTGAQFLDHRRDVDRFNEIWDRLCVCARTPQHSARFIDALRAHRATQT